MSSYYFDPNHVYSRKPSNTKKGQVIQKKIIDESRFFTNQDVKRFLQFLVNNPSLNPWYSPYSFVPYLSDYHFEGLNDPEDFDFSFNSTATPDNWVTHNSDSTLVCLPTLISGSFVSTIRYNTNLDVYAINFLGEHSLLSYSNFTLNSNGTLLIPNNFLPISTETTIQFEMNIGVTIADTAIVIISLVLLSGSTKLYTGYATILFKPSDNGRFLNLNARIDAVLVFFDAHYQALKDFEPDFNK